MFYAALRARGGKDGQPLSASSVRRVHTIVRSALNQGVRWGLLSSNPAQRASPGPVEDRDVDPPSPAELLRLFDAAEQESPDLVMFLVLAAVSGARRSEMCALRWSDFGLGVVTIARGVVIGALDDQNRRRFEGHLWPAGRERGKPTALIEKEDQDQAAAHDQPRPDHGGPTVALLVEYRASCEERAAACGTTLPATAFLFSMEPDGSRPWRPDVVTRQFGRLCKKLGIVGVRLHDLRHFVVISPGLTA